MQQASSSRRILLSVSGMSPQIITETLYALITQPEPWLPDEIHLITTAQGKENAELQLLAGKKHFKALLAEYGITYPIHFTADTIHVIADAGGNPLADLRTPADNEAAADCIVSHIRTLTSRPNTELHVSLAGGRKTMGFYAGYALSLFGRQQDRLSHVLVSEEYESNRDFFFPTRSRHVIYNRDGKPLDTAQAQVWLAQIPFVRLRSFLPDETLLTDASFSEVIALVDALAGNPQVVLNLEDCTLNIGEIRINLPTREMSLYLMFVHNLKKGDAHFVLRKNDTSAAMAAAFLQALASVKGQQGEMEAQAKALKNGMDRDYFDPVKSRLHKSITKKLGQRGAEKYLIKSGPRGSSELFLELDPEWITVKE